MRKADQFTATGFPRKLRTEAQLAADAARSTEFARARKAKVERLARQRSAAGSFVVGQASASLAPNS